MPPKSSITDELESALRDPRVTETLANLIESKIQPLIDTIAELKSENERKAATILKLTTKVEELETYTPG